MSGRRAVSLTDYWRLLRTNRNYRLLWGAQVISEIGDWFFTLAIYTLLLDFTGRAESVAFAFVLQVLPQLFAAPAAGIISDRLSRRKVMIIADVSRAFIIGAMLLVRSPDMLWLLYVLLLLETVMWGLFEPARTATIPNITTGEEIFTGNALSSTTWSFNFAMGFTVGGLATAFLGRDAVFAIDAVSFLVSASLIRRMSFAEPHTEGQAPMRVRDIFDFRPIVDGFRYVRRDSRLFATLFVKSGNSLIASNWVLLTVLGREQFAVHGFGLDPSRAGALGMSVLMGCRGLGAIIGPVTAGYVAGRSQERQRWAIFIGFLLASGGYLLLSTADNIATACLGVMIAHGGSSVTWVGSTTLLQLNTEDRFRGRVFSAEFGCSVVVMSLASSSAGRMIDQGMPLLEVARITGLAMLVPAVLWLFALRLWSPSRLPQIPPETPAA